MFTVILGIITGILGLVFLFFHLNPEGTYSGFAVSILWHPNYTAYIYTVTILATVYYFDCGKLSMFGKTFILAGIFIQFYALYLTNCRAAMIGITIGIAVYLFVKYKEKRILFGPILVILILIAMVRIYAIKDTTSTFSRGILLFSAIDMITQSKERFLWGYGLTNNLIEFKYFMVKHNQLENINSPHNNILSLIIMGGAIFTFFVVSYLIYVLYKTLIGSIKAIDKMEKLFFVFLFSSLVALIVYTFFDSQIVMLEFFSMQYFLIFFGISHYYISHKKKGIQVRNIWNDWK